MNTTHHLNEKILLGYSAGVLPEAFNLVVASHLCLSDEGRAMQCCYDAIGGAVLNKCDKEKMSLDALSATLHQIKTCPCDTKAPEICTGIFPEPLQAYVGDQLDTIRWRSLGKGVRQAIIPTAKGASVRLLFVPAGQSVPDHGHCGTELTLVLQGAFRDQDKYFRRGDIEVATTKTAHQPVADSKQDCICLTATDAPLRFRRLIPRFIGRLLGL